MKNKKNHQILSGGQVVVESLKINGVKNVFGLIGSATMELFDSLYDTNQIKFIGVRDERTGTHMADGYARASGQPGIIIAGQNGPGATNLVTGVAQAAAAYSPVISIAGAASSKPDFYNKFNKKNFLNEFQEVDQYSLFKPITKRVITVDDIAGIPTIFRHCFEVAMSTRCGPVHINLPRNILSNTEKLKNIKMSKPYRVSKVMAGIFNPVSIKDIYKACNILNNAERPVIILGWGIKNTGKYDDVVKLADKLNAPIVTSAGHGDAIPFNNILNAGQMGPRGNPIASELTKEADVILALGTRLGFNSTFYSNDFINKDAKIIQVELLQKYIGKYFPVALGICADANAVTKKLIPYIKIKKRKEIKKWFQQFRNKHTSYLKERETKALFLKKNKLIQPASLFKELRDVLPSNAAITLDAGTLCLQATDALNYFEPKTLFTPLDFGLVGFSFACGLGVKVARPDRPVISLIGDGGFGMTISELSTAIYHNINTIIVVMNNHSWGAEKAYQRDFFKKRYIGSEIHNPPFHEVAKLYGAKGFHVKKISQIKNAMKKALKSSKPVVINVEVDPEALYSFRRDSFKHRSG